MSADPKSLATMKSSVAGRSGDGRQLRHSETEFDPRSNALNAWRLILGRGSSCGTPGHSPAAKCRSHRRTGFLETDGSTGSLQSQDFSSRGVGSDARGFATFGSET